MNEFKIEINENLSKIIKIQANSEEEAIEIAKSMYKNEKIILDSKDFIDKEIKLVSDE